MKLEPHIRNLHAAILCARAEGLFSARDRTRHYEVILRGMARRAGAARDVAAEALGQGGLVLFSPGGVFPRRFVFFCL